ncbi:MAG: HAMP domain-containing protein [Desulfarculus sp.]|nr:HAMP domain-containing protein [Desulfarculus sp.]
MDQAQQTKELRRRKRERVIMAVLLVVVVLVTFVETQVVRLPHDLPLGASILVFALINLNALLLLLLIFLVFRNLFKLTVERRQGVWGSQLRTKLVVAFVILSLAPTILLFFAAFQFVGTSIEYWFSAQVEGSLIESLEGSEQYHQQMADGALHFSELLAADLGQRGPSLAGPSKALNEFLEARRGLYDLAAVRLFAPGLGELGHATQSGTHLSHLDYLPLDLVTRVLAEGKPLSHLQAAPTGDFVAAVQPFPASPKAGGRVLGVVVAFKLLPKGSLARVQGVQKGLENYRQLKSLKRPIKTNQYITLSIVTLLIIFAGTWFGFHLAKTITVPLMEVAQGTQRVAGGDYDFHIDLEGPDEIGALVNAFNRMTADLKTSKARLDEAQEEMRRTNLELEQRRRYMEIVLKNVAAGVVAVDAGGHVTTFNPSAERLLKVQAPTVLGSHWRNVVEGENRDLVERMLGNLSSGGRGSVDQQVRLNIGGEALTLMVHLNFMRDEAGQALGMVVVFEDLSELEKAQRMAAWREVARRIAHEVKNPLTPIKLSAQRLVRRYEERLGDDAQIFKECTGTIIHQVEELRRLVNEFSTFARLPSARLAPQDLTAIAEEALSLFRGGHGDISFEMEAEEGIPIFDLDREQMARAIINLLDNAVAALEDSPPPKQVVVRLSHDDILKIVRLEVEDTGPGVPAADRLRLFEPYYSTKKGGTGLGLAIVSTIVADHNGYIRVQDNQPRGTRIIIELPARGARVAAV